jgi:hypothetical protein
MFIMALSHNSSGGDARPRPRTPAERGEEFMAVQRRLKEEAAARRKVSQAKGSPRRATGLSQQTGRSGGRRTP